MARSENSRLVELLEICEVMIERDFAPAAEGEQVVERIKGPFAE